MWRIAAHLLSIVLLIPGLLFATAALAIGHLAAQTGLLAILGALLDIGLMLVPWAFLAAFLLLVLGFLGFFDRHRWAAALCVAGTAAGSSGVLLWTTDWPIPPGQAGIFVPSALAFAIALWLAASEWPRLADARTG